MSATMESEFCYGDVVEHKMNTNVFGMVMGFEGSLVIVRLCPSLDIDSFHDFELQLADFDEFEEPTPYDPEKGGAEVINFTEAKALRANTKTRGVA